MTDSKRYKELKSASVKLRRDMLPNYFKKNQNYTREHITRTIAYHILIHAEIEAYIENRSWDIALAAKEKWDNEKKATRIILALLAFSGLSMDKPPHSILPDQPSQLDSWEERIRLSSKVTRAANGFYLVITNNHGIKEANVIRMLLPIGVNPDELDTVLLADLNSYGETRGYFAHTHYQEYRATMQIDPKEEFDNARRIIENIASIDEILNNLSIELE